MSSHYPFLRTTALAAAAFVLLTPASPPVRAQTPQQAALSGGGKTDSTKTDTKAEAPKPEAAKPTETPAAGGANSGKVTAVDQGNPAQKNLATKAIEKWFKPIPKRPASPLWNQRLRHASTVFSGIRK